MPTKPKKATKTTTKKKAPRLNQVTIFINVDDEDARVDLFDEYVTEAQLHRVFALVENIGPLPKPPRRKSERSDPPRDDAKEFVYEILRVLESPACPVQLHSLIADYLTDMGQTVLVADFDGRTAQASDPLHIRLLSKWLPLALEADNPQAPALRPANFKRAAEQLAVLIEDPNTPSGLSDALSNAVLQFVEQHDGSNTGIEVARFQLANAIAKAANATPES